jgi:hypothetical protein
MFGRLSGANSINHGPGSAGRGVTIHVLWNSSDVVGWQDSGWRRARNVVLLIGH